MTIEDGIHFEVPYLCAAGVLTRDGRVVEHFRGADPPPLPFTDRHRDNVRTGVIRTLMEDDGEVWSARGLFDLSHQGLLAARLAAAHTVDGVSIDTAQAEPIMRDGRKVIPWARIRGASQLQRGAFTQAHLIVDPADIAKALVAGGLRKAADRYLSDIRNACLNRG